MINEIDSVNIYEDIIELVQEKTFQEIQLNTIIKDLNIGSIDYVFILVTLEEKYDIEFPDEALLVDYFNTINDLVTYVKCKS